jgi:hypothetical protein
MLVLIVCSISLATMRLSQALAQSGQSLPGCWPQEYSVQQDDTSGMLTLSTPYYAVQHNLKKGGAISKIKYTHGKVDNVLVRPIKTSVQIENGTTFDDVGNPTAHISHTKTGKTEILISECSLVGQNGQDSGIKVKTTYEYRWGYIKIRKALYFPADSLRIKNLTVLSAIFDASMSDYGYREGITEQEGEAPFSFGICRWGKAKAGAQSAPPLNTHYVPRYLVLANHGIEGIEWFVSSDLSQWDFQLTGRRGDGLCDVHLNLEPAGIAVSICPLSLNDVSAALKGVYTFDYYIGMPILEGHANKPWLHRTFNRNKGQWLTEEEIKQCAEAGVKTVHCHNDGDYYADGLFWRDGSYPPYSPEDMGKFDRVIETCHKYGIKVTTYFSDKELHSSTQAFKEHDQEWARKDNQGNLKYNYFRAGSEFGVQMCLKSGWLQFLELSVDRVLKNHNLDGVYYDWNAALFCSNPSHTEKKPGDASTDKAQQTLSNAQESHWDMDELIELMEWTRQRVGPDGVIIVHNTRVPMFVTENFANYVVAMEWGYEKWSKSIPKLQELPLEWDFVGARSRGVIGYGLIDPDAPRRFHKVLAVETLLTGVAPWPASPEAVELHKMLKPLGNLEQYKFEDWRNKAITLDNENCASAVYSRPGEAYVLLGNLDPEQKKIVCVINPRNLPYPLSSVNSGEISGTDTPVSLDVGRLMGDGENIALPGDGVVLVHIK